MPRFPLPDPRRPTLTRPARRAGRAAALPAILLAALPLGACVTDTVSGVTGAVTSARTSFTTYGDAQVRSLQMFVASTRPGRGEASASGARFALTAVTIPPGHEAGVIERPQVTPESPRRHFTLGRASPLGASEFGARLASHVSGRVGSSRDVLVFVHGFNTSEEEASFRLAQVATDAGFTGVPVLFTWPSRSRLFAYGADRESAAASRDALEALLRTVSETPGVGQVHVLAHSMGTWLAMESLRQAAIAGRPDLNGRLGEVMLAAPDIDLDVFRAQMSRLGGARVSLFVAADDRALQASRVLAGDRPRVGALDLTRGEERATLERLGVRVYDLTRSSGARDRFRHGTFAEAPGVVRAIGAQLNEARVADAQAVLGEPVARGPAPADGARRASPPESAPAAVEPLGVPHPGAVTSEPLPPPPGASAAAAPPTTSGAAEPAGEP